MKPRTAFVPLLAAIFLIWRCDSVRAAAGDENWDSNFGVPGADGEILTLEIVGSDLFAGGQFSTIGGVSANHVARWDGANWHPLGLGVDGLVSAIVASGGEIYVGGTFTHAGGILATNI